MVGRIVLALLLLLIAVGSVEAVTLGVNKGVISYDKVLQGGYAEDTVFVSTDNPEPQLVTYEFTGDVADWFRIEPENESFHISASGSQVIRVIVEPPEDAQTGNYTANLRLTSGLFDTAQGDISTSVKGAFSIRLLVEVTGDEVVECVSGGYVIRDAEVGELPEFELRVRNRGNVRLQPEMEIDVWDQSQTKLMATLTERYPGRILPTTEQAFMRVLDLDLPRGQYWADIAVGPCDDGGLITFDILGQGEISDKGTLLRLESQPWAEAGDIVPIKGVFQNTGETTVSAKLRATITKDGKVIGIIESDPLSTGPGQIVTIEEFYRPNTAGQYFVAGRVVYNDKLTGERTSILNVNSGEGFPAARFFSAGTVMTLILILIVIMVLLILIRGKRSKRHRTKRKL